VVSSVLGIIHVFPAMYYSVRMTQTVIDTVSGEFGDHCTGAIRCDLEN